MFVSIEGEEKGLGGLLKVTDDSGAAVGALGEGAATKRFGGRGRLDRLIHRAGVLLCNRGKRGRWGGAWRRNLACGAVVTFRYHDGSNQLGDMHPGAYSDYSGFTPANTLEVLRDPNRWQPLLVNGVAQRWLLPQWGLVKPFAEANLQFRARAGSRPVPISDAQLLDSV